MGTLLPSDSPIQGIVLNGMGGKMREIFCRFISCTEIFHLGNAPVRSLAKYLNNQGFIVKPICSPTVPKGQERVRICLHGHNTFEQVDALVAAVHTFFNVKVPTGGIHPPSSSSLESAKL